MCRTGDVTARPILKEGRTRRTALLFSSLAILIVEESKGKISATDALYNLAYVITRRRFKYPLPGCLREMVYRHCPESGLHIFTVELKWLCFFHLISESQVPTSSLYFVSVQAHVGFSSAPCSAQSLQFFSRFGMSRPIVWRQCHFHVPIDSESCSEYAHRCVCTVTTYVQKLGRSIRSLVSQQHLFSTPSSLSLYACLYV